MLRSRQSLSFILEKDKSHEKNDVPVVDCMWGNGIVCV